MYFPVDPCTSKRSHCGIPGFAGIWLQLLRPLAGIPCAHRDSGFGTIPEGCLRKEEEHQVDLDVCLRVSVC